MRPSDSTKEGLGADLTSSGSTRLSVVGQVKNGLLLLSCSLILREFYTLYLPETGLPPTQSTYKCF